MKRAFCIVVLVAGCASRAPAPMAHVATPIASPRAPDADLEPLLENRCGVCHDGTEPGRPVFDTKHALQRSDAMRVVLALASGAMPPPPAELSHEDLQKLIELACVRESRGVEPAEACVTRFARPAPERWLVNVDAMVHIAERAVLRTEPGVGVDEQARQALAAEFVLTAPEARAVRLEGTISLLLALHASERCGDPARIGEPAYRACVYAVTDYRALAMPSFPKVGAQ